jgi:hypothetical protein
MEVSNKVCIFAPCYNENNIIEWMDYHFKCGVELIIIYDDQSDIAVKDVVESYGRFDENKYIILENLCPQYFSGETKDNCKYPQSCIRSAQFFQEIKQYMKDCSHCLSIDMDEYLYMGEFNTIHELINYYEPFDQLYFYWRTFKSLVKYATSTVIDKFTHSNKELDYCGKCLIKLSKTDSQTGPHFFDAPKNCIYYPNENYNFIYKDIFNTHITELNQYTGLPEDSNSITNFYTNMLKETKFPYIAHYRNQSIETFIKRRLIDRLLLVQKNKSRCLDLCNVFFNGKYTYENLLNHTCLLTKNPNIVEYVEYIYDKMNESDRDKLNLYKDGMFALETMDDISRYYWSLHPNDTNSVSNLDIYNYYKT